MSGEPTVELIGNVGADPELRFTADGTSVASFPVAVTPRKKQGNDWVDQDTQWFRVSAWRRDAEAVTEHVSKGARVRVEGQLKASTYEASTGETRLSLDVSAHQNGVTLVPKPQPRETRTDDPWA